MKQCYYCEQSIPREARVCAHCHRRQTNPRLKTFLALILLLAVTSAFGIEKFGLVIVGIYLLVNLPGFVNSFRRGWKSRR